VTLAAARDAAQAARALVRDGNDPIAEKRAGHSAHCREPRGNLSPVCGTPDRFPRGLMEKRTAPSSEA